MDFICAFTIVNKWLFIILAFEVGTGISWTSNRYSWRNILIYSIPNLFTQRYPIPRIIYNIHFYKIRIFLKNINKLCFGDDSDS